jgi:hypothetical protein
MKVRYEKYCSDVLGKRTADTDFCAKSVNGGMLRRLRSKRDGPGISDTNPDP